MRTLNTADGITLHSVDWPAPDAASARGTVLLVHGHGEHIGRYSHVAEHLRRAGWQVCGYDHRGHGRSGGPRGRIPAPDNLLSDLGQVITAVRAAHPGRLVLLGHSMGGVTVGRYVAEGLAARPAAWWQPVDALVMSSPALDAGVTAVQKGLIALLGALAPGMALGNGINPRWVCRDPAVVQAYIADPLVHNRINAPLARFIVDAGEATRAVAARWTVPTLLLYAGADRCVAPRGSDAFAAAAPTAVVRAHRFDGLAHEIFNEPEQAQVLAELSAWLNTLPAA